MTADEIFVLILVVVCVGALVAAEVRSRRQKLAVQAAGVPEQVREPEVAEPDAPRAAADRKRKRRR
jgi:hypothetical protein